MNCHRCNIPFNCPAGQWSTLSNIKQSNVLVTAAIEISILSFNCSAYGKLITYYPTINDSQSSLRQVASIEDGSLYALILASVGGHRLSNSNTMPLSKLAAINSFGAVVTVETHELRPVGMSHFFISLSASHNLIDFESPPTTIVWDRCCQHVDIPRASTGGKSNVRLDPSNNDTQLTLFFT